MEKQISLLQVIFLLFCVFHLHLALPDSKKDNEVSQFSVLPQNICPKLICGPSNITITFLKEDLAKLQVNFNDIYLIEPTCGAFEDNQNNIYINIRTTVKYCGTESIVNQTHVIYKNTIYLPPNPPSGIQRKEYLLNVSCVYPLNMNTSLGTVLNPILSTEYIYIIGSGQFEVKMALFKDPAYTIPRQDGDMLSTEDTLYVGVTITEGDESNFQLVMKNCFATPTQNFYDHLKYYIIQNSCKNGNDTTINVPANGIASFAQFSVQAFKFIGGYSRIFLHCQVYLCDRKKLDACLPVCKAGRHSADLLENQDTYLSIGEIAVKDPKQLCPNLQCGTSYINVTFKKIDLIDANVDIQELHLNNPNCHNVHDDGNIVSIGWPLGVGQCGTTMTTNASHAIYRNSIYLAPNPPQIIYRHDYYINISCAYILDMNVSLHTVLNPIISKINVSLEGTGSFEIVMTAFKDPAYQVPYQGAEIQLSTDSTLFVGVLIYKGDTSQFNLVMQHCYATPSSNPEDATKYGIIVNSCPNKDDGTILVPANGILSQGQFSIQMFKFFEQKHVYLHCEVHLCSKSSGTCLPFCPSVEKGRSAAAQGNTISLGPIHRAVTTTTKTTAKSHAGKGTCVDLLTLVLFLLISVLL